MDPDGAILSWERDKSAVCARIEQQTATLKIVLKIKNDPFFLGRWIRHHAQIVGLRNLIIFDNMSNHPAMLRAYQTLAADLQVVRFAGMCNNLHDTTQFPELYAALRRSTDCFIFLDADEYLVLLEANNRWRRGTSLLSVLERNRDVQVFPAAWLTNVRGTDSRFYCGNDIETLSQGLRWGKPIIRSSANASGFINHSTQLDPALFAPRLVTQFFVLHLLQLSVEQRIRSNLHKLIAREFITPDQTAEDVAAMDASGNNNQNIRLYVNEIKWLLPMRKRPPVPPVALEPTTMELMPNGQVSFFSDAERRVVAGYLANADGVAGNALGIPAEREPLVEPVTPASALTDSS